MLESRRGCSRTSWVGKEVLLSLAFVICVVDVLSLSVKSVATRGLGVTILLVRDVAVESVGILKHRGAVVDPEGANRE
jgi:hypothetical protein